MIDLAQVSLALRNCSARSLILLDEFGKGTLSTGSLISFLTSSVGVFFPYTHILHTRWISGLWASTDPYLQMVLACSVVSFATSWTEALTVRKFSWLHISMTSLMKRFLIRRASLCPSIICRLCSLQKLVVLWTQTPLSIVLLVLAPRHPQQPLLGKRGLFPVRRRK